MTTHTPSRLMAAASTFSAAVAIGLASAGVAQAHCVSNDNSSPCWWTFNSADSNSPNLYAQADANQFPLDVYPGNTSCYIGYWWSGSRWFEGAPGEQCGQYPEEVQLFNTATPGQTEHVLNTSSTTYPNQGVEIYF